LHQLVNKKKPVVLYGCETWLFTLREERRLRVFENRVLSSGVPRGVLGVQTPEIRMALQNPAKLNPIVETVKNC